MVYDVCLLIHVKQNVSKLNNSVITVTGFYYYTSNTALGPSKLYTNISITFVSLSHYLNTNFV